jgi:hypothetical protein
MAFQTRDEAQDKVSRKLDRVLNKKNETQITKHNLRGIAPHLHLRYKIKEYDIRIIN